MQRRTEPFLALKRAECGAQQVVAVFRTQKIFKVVLQLNAATDKLQVNLVCDNGASRTVRPVTDGRVAVMDMLSVHLVYDSGNGNPLLPLEFYRFKTLIAGQGCARGNEPFCP